MYHLRYLEFHKMLFPTFLGSLISSFILVCFNIPIKVGICFIVFFSFLCSLFIISRHRKVSFLSLLKSYFTDAKQINVSLFSILLLSFCLFLGITGYLWSSLFHNEVYYDFSLDMFTLFFVFLFLSSLPLLLKRVSFGNTEQVFKSYLSLSYGEDLDSVFNKFSGLKNVFPPELDTFEDLPDGSRIEKWVWWVDWKVSGENGYIYLTFENKKLVNKVALLDN